VSRTFFGSEVPPGEVEKKITEEEEIVDEAFFGRERFPEKPGLCRGKEFFCKF